MIHKDIVQRQSNKYSYREFLSSCASNNIDAISVDEWSSLLSTMLAEEKMQHDNMPQVTINSKGCCGGGKIR